MDVIMADKMDQALLKAAVALLKCCEGRLLQLQDMEDALHLLKLELPGVCVCGGGGGGAGTYQAQRRTQLSTPVWWGVLLTL